MATATTDYEGWTVPFYWSERDEELKAALEGIAAFFRAKVAASGAAAEPGDYLAGIELGDSSAHNDARIYYDGTSLLVQKNTGSEGSPSWTTVFTMTVATGAITTAAGITAGGALDMGGAAITNAASINTVSPAAHVSRHQPGGADALVVATPSDIGATNAEGVATSMVRSDHQHKGLRSLNGLFGDTNVTGGTGITVSVPGTDVVVTSDQRVYASFDNTSPADIVLTGTNMTPIGAFENIAIPGADGAGDYLITFFSTIATATGTESTVFRIHYGTTGDETDTIICNLEVTSEIGVQTSVFLQQAVVNPTSSHRVTVSYHSTNGSRHSIEGDTDGRPILTMTRLTSFTAI